ncbi:MAG: right-handed parallel beta-helix repeat-containing protein [Kiritimatiellae bacterium]|nr:right-handed parallel beta-helix repeat-containing protein [Kiritimatiellia bacterium]
MTARRIKVTVGPSGADIIGETHFAIQGAIDYVAALGGGAVELRPGTYRLDNSVRLRSHVHLIGAGEKTVLIKNPSVTVSIVEDTDWYEHRVTVADASAFRVGGGILLQGKCPHSGWDQVVIHTIQAIEDRTLWLDTQARGADGGAHRGNFWVQCKPTASTIFSLVTANWGNDIRVANLVLDGNRERSGALNSCYGAALYFQDCEQIRIEDVQAGHIESDGLSFQVVHDLTVENCRFTDAVQGIHPGSGAQRPIIRNNVIRRCTDSGLFWCWGVRHGLAENNIIEDCPTGISIGHRDTDNIMRGNTVRQCSRQGLLFRGDPPAQAAHNNLIENNLFEDIGAEGKPGYGIDMNAPVGGNILRGNRLVCTRKGWMKAGIRIGEKVAHVVLDDNRAEGLDCPVEDLRKTKEQA